MSNENFFEQNSIKKQETNKFDNFKSTLEQVTTRGDGKLELGEYINKSEIDFSAVLDHIKIHREGDVAGSQFNDKVFEKGADIESLLKNLLPEKLQLDQYNRAELTFDISSEQPEPIGWSGVKSIDEIRQGFPGVNMENKMRIPGGITDTVESVEGSWFPEKVRNDKGIFEVLKNENGEIVNPRAQFVPKSNVAVVPKENFYEISKTNKLTLIIQKDLKSNKPVALTIFPGENAPAGPVKIDTKAYKFDSLNDKNSRDYWETHAFIQTV